MSDNKALRPVPPSLPDTVAEFRTLRKGQIQHTLNDVVEQYHLKLYDNEDYTRLLYAVYDEQAVEGSLAADNIEAARMLRLAAQQENNIVLAREKLATISKSLGVVLRRYGSSRRERRDMIGGEIVPNDE